MRTTLFLIAIATAFSGANLFASDGWGQKQTQRTIGGAIGGGTIGGVIGHQSGKQKEGIIIGSILGMIIGNQSGKGADYREEQREWEARQREMAHRERMRQQEQQRIENARRRHVEYHPPVHTHTTSNNRGIVSDEVTQARHRAEQREAELQQEIEIRRIQEERRRALAEFQERERRAQEQLQRLRNGESISQDRPVY